MRFMPKRGQEEKKDHEKIKEFLTTKSARWPPVADRFLNFRWNGKNGRKYMGFTAGYT